MPIRGRDLAAALGAALLALAAAGCRPTGEAGPLAAPTDQTELFAVGEAAYWAAEFDSAQAQFERALAQARSEGDRAAEAEALTWLGGVAYRRADYPAAREWLGRSLDLQQRHGLTAGLWRANNLLGLVSFLEDRYYDALDRHALAAELADAARDTVSLAKSWNNQALALTELDDFDRARRLFLQALPVARSTGQTLMEGRVLVNLGMLAVRTGDPESALRYLGEAEGPITAADDVMGRLNRLGQLGTVWASMGEPGRAIAHLDSALAEARARDQLDEAASNLSHMASVYADAGDYPRALRLLDESLALQTGLGETGEAAATLLRTAAIHLELGNLDVARAATERSVESLRATGDRLDQMHGLLLLARVTLEGGDTTRSARHLAEAEALARALDAPAPRLAVALAAARLADHRGNADAMRRALAGAAAFLAAGGMDATWEYHWLAGRAAARDGNLRAAEAAAVRAVEAVERIRGEFGSGLLRTRYQSVREAVYRDLVDVRLRLGRVAEAFEAADQSRGRALLDHLASVRSGSGPTARELAEEERQHLRQIDNLTTALARVRDAGRRVDERAYRSEIGRLTADLERVRNDYGLALVRAEERRPLALVGGTRPSLARVRAALASDEALLAYYLFPDRLVSFVVTPGAVRHFSTPVDRAALATRIRVARELVGRLEPSRSAPQALEALHEVLLGDARRAGALTGAGTIIVVPHGELEYVPFAALRDSASGRYLVEDVTLLHLPSAAALPALRERAGGPRPARTTVALAPFPQDLPHSVEEARAVAETFPDGQAVLGPQASERQVRDALRDARTVHLATHGVLNVRNPLFSRVELAGGRAGGESPDDGRLEVHEVNRLAVGADLVFLSGCETGLGPTGTTVFSAGEDYATLVRAFLHAGAGNVVATLWRVEDRGAAEFARRFYREVRAAGAAGRPAEPAALGKALARAQREMLRDPAWAAPYRWAGYRLTGTGETGEPARLAARSVPDQYTAGAAGHGTSRGHP